MFLFTYNQVFLLSNTTLNLCLIFIQKNKITDENF